MAQGSRGHVACMSIVGPAEGHWQMMLKALKGSLKKAIWGLGPQVTNQAHDAHEVHKYVLNSQTYITACAPWLPQATLLSTAVDT